MGQVGYITRTPLNYSLCINDCNLRCILGKGTAIPILWLPKYAEIVVKRGPSDLSYISCSFYSWITIKTASFWPCKKKILGPVHVNIRSDKLDYLKKSQADFFQNYIKSKHLPWRIKWRKIWLRCRPFEHDGLSREGWLGSQRLSFNHTFSSCAPLNNSFWLYAWLIFQRHGSNENCQVIIGWIVCWQVFLP